MTQMITPSVHVAQAAEMVAVGIAKQVGSDDRALMVSCCSQAVIYQIEDWQQHMPQIVAGLADLLVVLACRDAVLRGVTAPLPVQQSVMVAINRRFHEHQALFAMADQGGQA